jgi:predicted small lipoprotein YifL
LEEVTVFRKLLSVFGVVALALAFVACEKKGPLEKAGEKADEAIEDVGEAAEEVKEDVEDAIDDGEEAVDEALEDDNGGH